MVPRSVESEANGFAGIAYEIPDLDGLVQVIVRDRVARKQVACVQAQLSNGRTVEHPAAGWVTAIVAIIGIGTAVILVSSGHGRSEAARHVATYALTFLGFLQAQAIIGLMSVPMPPLPQGWTQNFQWSMGIIELEWMQDIFTWYIKATGGKTSNILNDSLRSSVLIQRRSLSDIAHMVGEQATAISKRALDATAHQLSKRSQIEGDGGILILRGFDRVAHKAGIERSNLFLTSLVFFLVFVGLVVLATIIFKYGADFAARKGWMPETKFMRFRMRWRHFLKGAFFQLYLIGFSQMSIMCLWEFTQNDSSGAMMLAVFYFFGILLLLGWAAFNLLKESRFFSAKPDNREKLGESPERAGHKFNKKWNLLCVTFRKDAYWFLAPLLFYMFIKAIFVSIAQNAGSVQALALVILELVYLVAAAYLRPWMDQRTNTCNITVAVLNFLNALYLLIFCGLFKVPGMATSIIGVIFFIMNGVATLTIMIIVIVSTINIIRNKDRLHNADDSIRSSVNTLPGQAIALEDGKKPAQVDGPSGDDKAAEAAAIAYRGASRPGTVRSSTNRSNTNRQSLEGTHPPSRTSTRASQRQHQGQYNNDPYNQQHPMPHGMMQQSNHSQASNNYNAPHGPFADSNAPDRAWSRNSNRSHASHHTGHGAGGGLPSSLMPGGGAGIQRSHSPAHSAYSNPPLPPSYPYAYEGRNGSGTSLHPERIPLPRNDSWHDSVIEEYEADTMTQRRKSPAESFGHGGGYGNGAGMAM